MSILDLSSFITLDEITHEVSRNTRRTGWKWKLADTGHPQVVAFRNERERKDLKKQADIEQRRMNGRKIKVEEEDPIEARRAIIEMVASRVLGFDEVSLPLKDLPNPVKYSPEMVVKLFEHPKLDWLFLDIVNRINDDTAFMPPEAKN